MQKCMKWAGEVAFKPRQLVGLVTQLQLEIKLFAMTAVVFITAQFFYNSNLSAGSPTGWSFNW